MEKEDKFDETIEKMNQKLPQIEEDNKKYAMLHQEMLENSSFINYEKLIKMKINQRAILFLYNENYELLSSHIVFNEKTFKCLLEQEKEFFKENYDA